MLPKKYKYLVQEPAPKMLLQALSEYGTLEVVGNGNNPKILAWAQEVGSEVAEVYKADAIPWCGLAMAIFAQRAGKMLPKSPLWALSWAVFGDYIETPMLGDVLVFTRRTADGKKAGHVSLYVGEDKTTYHCLGGNQSDAINITRIVKTRLYTSRRAEYKLGVPPNIRRVFISASGEVSNNES